MSEISALPTSIGQPAQPKPKKPRVLKPKAKPGPNSFRYGPARAALSPSAAAFGPCSLHVDIDSKTVIGDPKEAEAIRAFCEGFLAHPTLCLVKGYGIAKGTWTVSVYLASEGKDVKDEFVSEMFRQLKDMFDASSVLKHDFGAGKARFRVLNGDTTVDDGPLN